MGKPVRQTTGMYYDYQRWYDPSIGRFISTDPGTGSLANPQSLNPYASFLNSPTNYVDPDGGFPMPVNSPFTAIAAIFSEWLARAHDIPGTGYRIEWGPGAGAFHTIVVVSDPNAPKGWTKQVWKLDAPDSDVPWYHQGGRADTGAFTHQGYDPVDPELGGYAEGFGRLGAVEGATHALLGLSLVLSALDIYSAYVSDRNSGDGYTRTIQTASEQVAGWAGAYVGAEILGGYGLELGFEFGGPPGAAVGGLIGGLVGSIVGFMFGEQAVDNLIGPGAQGPYNGLPPCNELGIESSIFGNTGGFCPSGGVL